MHVENENCCPNQASKQLTPIYVTTPQTTSETKYKVKSLSKTQSAALQGKPKGDKHH